MLSQFFIDRPRFAFVISIIIMVAGFIALGVMPVSQYPEMTPSQVSVTAVYPGADAETIQKTVVQPLESKINGTKRMMYVSSSASDDGTASINVTFPAGTDGDINTVNVQNRVTQVTSQLPDVVKQQGVITQEQSTSFLLIISLYSPNKTYNSLFLSNYLSLYVNDELARVNGVGSTTLFGSSDYAMRIWLDRDRMTALKMNVEEVLTALKDQNVQTAAGAVGDAPIGEDQEFRYSVQTQGRLESPEEFGKIIVRTDPDGSQVRLSDIAEIELGGEDYTSTARLYSSENDQGLPTGLLAVFQLTDANALEIAAKCKAKMEELKKAFPPDIEYGIYYDSTKFVTASIAEVVETLVIAVLLVILVTFIFLQNWRATLIPTLAIPVSLIGTFAVLLVLGYSINLITLFALILAIGIVVDDAIVVVENVFRLMEEEHLDPVAAAKKSMMQVTGPVVATTLVLLAMFVPVCFLSGITGEIYRQFGVTISVAVLISSVNALTLSPALCATLLRSENHQKRKPFILFRAFNAVFARLTGGYVAVVSSFSRKAFLTMILYFLLCAGTVHLYNQVPSGFIPQEDQGAFFVELQLPDAAAFPRTDSVVNRVAAQVSKIPGVTQVMAISGRSMLNSNTASNSAFMVGIMAPWNERKTPETSQNAILGASVGIASELQEAAMMTFPVPTIPGLGSVGGFTFVIEDTTGTSPARLAEAIRLVTQEAETGNYPALDPRLLMSTFRANVPRIFLTLDREKAKTLGISIAAVNAVLQGLQGYSYVNDFNKFGKVYKVEIQGAAEGRATVEQLKQLYVRNDRGDMVPLSTLVEVETRFGPTLLQRYNLYSSVRLMGNSATGYSSGEAIAAMESIAEKVLPDGMRYEWTDMSYQEKQAGNQTLYVYALALLFIYLFLVAQYESWMIPLSVMLSVPIALCGSVCFLMMYGIDNNIYAQVGFVLLFGLACKTAILIVEFAKEQHDRTGMPIVEAAVFAAKLRFRAVLMTAVSFILGVLPLVIATGAGAESRKALGAVVFGGMLISCIFGTLLVPVFYTAAQALIDRFFTKKRL